MPQRLIRSVLASAMLIVVAGMAPLACVAGSEPGDEDLLEEAVSPGDEDLGEAEQAVAGSCGSSACTSWSSWYNIGSPFCGSPVCAIHTYPEWTYYMGEIQKQERFRWCSLSNGSWCQETEQKNVKIGCCYDEPL